MPQTIWLRDERGDCPACHAWHEKRWVLCSHALQSSLRASSACPHARHPAAHLQLCERQRCAHALHGLRPRRSPHHELREQRVVVGRHLAREDAQVGGHGEMMGMRGDAWATACGLRRSGHAEGQCPGRGSTPARPAHLRARLHPRVHTNDGTLRTAQMGRLLCVMAGVQAPQLSARWWRALAPRAPGPICAAQHRASDCARDCMRAGGCMWPDHSFLAHR